MSEYDLNLDGVVDTVTSDTYGDSVADVAGFDLNQNGRFESVWMDSNNDSVMDTYAYDTDDDGRFDVFQVDANQDGSADRVAYDRDENGVVDAMPTPTSGPGYQPGGSNQDAIAEIQNRGIVTSMQLANLNRIPPINPVY